MYLDPYYFIRDSKKFQKNKFIIFQIYWGLLDAYLKTYFFKGHKNVSVGSRPVPEFINSKVFRENNPKTLVYIIEIRTPDPLLTDLQDSGS